MLPVESRRDMTESADMKKTPDSMHSNRLLLQEIPYFHSEKYQYTCSPMTTAENLQSVRDQLDFLVERFNTHTLTRDDRTHLLRQMRVLLAKMDTLASSALLEHKEDTTDLHV
jgi:hypothetical protein